MLVDLLINETDIVQGLLSGNLVRYGGIIREAASGRIVRHLVESPSLTQQLLQLSSSPLLGGPSLVLNTVGHAVTIHKVAQVQETLKVTNQILSQVMGLTQIAAGASVLGLGVSLAGFAYMGYKLNQLQESISKMQQAMEVGFDKLDGKLDTISGQLSYLQLLSEGNREVQKQISKSLVDIHKAFLNREVSDLVSILQNRPKFPEAPVYEDIKKATSAKIFFSQQANDVKPQMDLQTIMIADISIQGWAIATSTEAYILLETGNIIDAKQILNHEIPRFQQLASQWIDVLLKDDHPELATAYRFLGNRFKGLISPERVFRIAELSSQDSSLTEKARQKRIEEIKQEFEMSYISRLDSSWVNHQVAISEYMDTLSELLARIESLEAFAALCDDLGVKSSRELLPNDSDAKGLYVLNPSQE